MKRSVSGESVDIFALERCFMSFKGYPHPRVPIYSIFLEGCREPRMRVSGNPSRYLQISPNVRKKIKEDISSFIFVVLLFLSFFFGYLGFSERDHIVALLVQAARGLSHEAVHVLVEDVGLGVKEVEDAADLDRLGLLLLLVLVLVLVCSRGGGRGGRIAAARGRRGGLGLGRGGRGGRRRDHLLGAANLLLLALILLRRLHLGLLERVGALVVRVGTEPGDDAADLVKIHEGGQRLFALLGEDLDAAADLKMEALSVAGLGLLVLTLLLPERHLFGLDLLHERGDLDAKILPLCLRLAGLARRDRASVLGRRGCGVLGLLLLLRLGRGGGRESGLHCLLDRCLKLLHGHLNNHRGRHFCLREVFASLRIPPFSGSWLFNFFQKLTAGRRK